MTGETVRTLRELGYSLYGFRVVRGSRATRPVVWFKSDVFAPTSTIEWMEQYEAYTSRSQVIPQGQVVTAASYPIGAGEVLTVNNPTGIGEVSHEGGSDGAIRILNRTSQRMTCGISQATPDGAMNPICAFPLLDNNMDEIIPTTKVFLMFSSRPVDTGVVVEQSYGPGILIDLAGVSTCSVSYDADAGWSHDEQTGWAISCPPNQSLVPLIIQPMK